MSVDSRSGSPADAPSGVDCSLCDGSLASNDGVVVQCYPESDGSLPAVAAADGFVGVCADCRDDLDELVDAWTEHDHPPVAADHSIGEGYRRVADDCSFCARTLGDEPLLGVERYPPAVGTADAAAADVANHSLCADCVPVFDQFLEQVRADSTA